MAPAKKSIIRTIYLYLISAITIGVFITASIGLINLVLKEYVFDVKGWQEVEDYWECDSIYEPWESDYTWECDDYYFYGDYYAAEYIVPEEDFIEIELEPPVFDETSPEEIVDLDIEEVIAYADQDKCMEDALADYDEALADYEKDVEDCEVEVDEQRALQHNNDVKRDFVWYLSMLIVALPIFLLHWGLIRRDEK